MYYIAHWWELPTCKISLLMGWAISKWLMSILHYQNGGHAGSSAALLSCFLVYSGVLFFPIQITQRESSICSTWVALQPESRCHSLLVILQTHAAMLILVPILNLGSELVKKKKLHGRGRENALCSSDPKQTPCSLPPNILIPVEKVEGNHRERAEAVGTCLIPNIFGSVYNGWSLAFVSISDNRKTYSTSK